MAETLARLKAEPGWAIAALDYELGYLLEPKAAPVGWQPSAAQPLARFWRFTDCSPLTADAAENWRAGQVSDAAAGGGGMHTRISEHQPPADGHREKKPIYLGGCLQG